MEEIQKEYRSFKAINFKSTDVFIIFYRSSLETEHFTEVGKRLIDFKIFKDIKTMNF